MREPGSTLRTVMTPSKGAYTFWKLCSSSRRFTFASSAFTVARPASTTLSASVTAEVRSSICCFDTVPGPATT
jgi:hypothetical protein